MAEETTQTTIVDNTKATFLSNKDDNIRKHNEGGSYNDNDGILGRNLNDVLGSRKTGREAPLHRIKIDNTFIGGYGTYSFYIQKTYAKEPERSTSGAIDNLDSYVTFLTPTVRLKFNAMSMTQYCELIKLMHSKNEFQVTCYDIVYGQERTFNAYFSPDDYPELFVLDLEMLAVLNYEIELIGTNTDLNTYSITYHLNAPDGTDRTVASNNYPMGQEVIVGQGAESVKSLDGYKFNGWNTNSDVEKGTPFVDGTAYKINADLVLYAQWAGNDEYKLSFDYGVGVIPKDSNNENITSITIKCNDKITCIDSEETKAVTFLEKEYNPYEETPKWYWTPTPVLGKEQDNSEEIISGTTVYSVNGNSTIYQLFSTREYSITFKDGNAESSTILSTVTGEYGSKIAKPNLPSGTKEWYISSVGGESVNNVPFSQSTMPPVDVVVYAK